MKKKLISITAIGIAIANLAWTQAPEIDNCSLLAPWYLETLSLSERFTQAMTLDLSEQENITRAIIEYYIVYFRLLLLQPSVPDCGQSLIDALLVYTQDFGEQTMFLLLIQALELGQQSAEMQIKQLMNQTQIDGETVVKQMKLYSEQAHDR